MKTITASILTMLTATLMMLNSSCRKDDIDDHPEWVRDQVIAESVFSEVKDMADEAWKESSKSGKSVGEAEWVILGPCATITHDTTVNPHLITIDFGSVNCLCNDGKYRRGIILVTYTGGYRDSGTVITHTFNNYFVNNHQVLGTKTVTNDGTDSLGKLTYSIVVNGTIIKPNNGGTITWSSNRTRVWIAGSNTLPWLDDVYLITGTASGTSANNTSFSMLITSPLRKEIGCKWFVSGTLEMTPSGKPVRIIDYGNGTCDNIATVTINNNTYTIYL